MIDLIISADDHMDLNFFPADVFAARVPRQLRSAVPSVVTTDDGPFWTLGDRRLRPHGRKGGGHVGADADHGDRPGRPVTRLEDMDVDGVYCQVIYGPPGGFGFIDDVETRAACYRAYNDWAVEFCSLDGDRLVMLAMLPVHEPGAATAELERVAAAGLKGVMVGLFESAAPIYEDAWEPFWTAAEAAGLPVHFHLGGGLHSLYADPGTWRHPAMVTVVPMQLDEALSGMIFSGTLERHPSVRLVLGESGLGWLPYIVERMDYEHHKYAKIVDRPLANPPSTYFARQVFATYEEDALGLELLDRIGFDNVMWASDYPHGDSTWPHSRVALEASPLMALGGQVCQKVLWDTAACLYSITGPRSANREAGNGS